MWKAGAGNLFGSLYSKDAAMLTYPHPNTHADLSTEPMNGDEMRRRKVIHIPARWLVATGTGNILAAILSVVMLRFGELNSFVWGLALTIGIAAMFGMLVFGFLSMAKILTDPGHTRTPTPR